MADENPTQPPSGMLRDVPAVHQHNAANPGSLRRGSWGLSAHKRLDEAVFAVYGCTGDLRDEEILEKLLALLLPLHFRSAHLHCTTPFGQAVQCKCR